MINPGKKLTISSLVLLFPLMIQADNTKPVESDSDKWHITVAFPMLWDPSIRGKVRGGERVDFEIGFDDILEDLSFGFMGELYLERGSFGAVLRTNYLNVTDESSVNGSLTKTDTETDITMGVNDILGSWRVHDKVHLLAGVRHMHAKVKLDLKSKLADDVLIDEKITVTDDNQFDFLLGINVEHWFNQKWGAMFVGDVGIAGDNDRDYSAEVRGLYKINHLHNVWFGYRYLNIGTDSEEDGITYEVDMIQQGPSLGWAFTFHRRYLC